MFHNVAAISGDTIASTRLVPKDGKKVGEELLGLFPRLQDRIDAHSSIGRGDHLECVSLKTEHASRIALPIKGNLKRMKPDGGPSNGADHRAKAFGTYGIWLAIGHGTLSRDHLPGGSFDGGAIQMAGRYLNRFHTYGKKKFVIKRTLDLLSKIDRLISTFNTPFWPVDGLVDKVADSQCFVPHNKLLGQKEGEISELKGLARPTVNAHATPMEWKAIEQAVNYFIPRS